MHKIRVRMEPGETIATICGKLKKRIYENQNINLLNFKIKSLLICFKVVNAKITARVTNQPENVSVLCAIQVGHFT